MGELWDERRKEDTQKREEKVQLLFERTVDQEVVVKRKRTTKSQHARFHHFHTNFLLNIPFPSPKRVLIMIAVVSVYPASAPLMLI